MSPEPKPKRACIRQNKAGHPQKHYGKVNSSAPLKDSISINSTKSKIRDVRRVLEHSQDLPPGVRIEKERALSGYKQDLEKVIEDKKRNEIIGKYHMVRFFERKKAERVLKKARAQLAKWGETPEGEGHEDELEQLRKKVHGAEVDVKYTMYYPLTEKYVSLFPKGEDSAKSKDIAPSSKPAVWTFVEQCMASGTLDMLRDGKYGVRPDGSVKTREEFAPKTSSNGGDEKRKGTARKSQVSNGEAGDEESDGGFFEEKVDQL